MYRGYEIIDGAWGEVDIYDGQGNLVESGVDHLGEAERTIDDWLWAP